MRYGEEQALDSDHVDLHLGPSTPWLEHPGLAAETLCASVSLFINEDYKGIYLPVLASGGNELIYGKELTLNLAHHKRCIHISSSTSSSLGSLHPGSSPIHTRMAGGVLGLSAGSPRQSGGTRGALIFSRDAPAPPALLLVGRGPPALRCRSTLCALCSEDRGRPAHRAERAWHGQSRGEHGLVTAGHTWASDFANN